MKTRKILAIITAALITVSTFAACNNTSQPTSSESVTQSVSTDTASAGTENNTANTADTAALADKSEEYFSERDLSNDYDESDAVNVTMSGTDFTVSGEGAKADKNVLTISKEGVYILSGTISDGRVVISAGDNDKVQLILKNCSVTCSDNPAIYVESAGKVFITTAAGTTNTITDGKTYNSDLSEIGVDSAIYSKTDLVINGSGTLNVNGNLSHAIVSKDDLKITGGTVSVVSVNSAVSGKDSVRIANANITVKSGADGIKSTNTEDTSKGYIYIESGTISVTSDGDAFSAGSDIIIADGTINGVSGGGHSKSTKTHVDDFMFGRNNTVSADTEDDTESTKGFKAGGSLTIKGGSISLDCADDTVHVSANVTVSGGDIKLSSGDDGIHADEAVTISDGTLAINESYEGIEGKCINITGGSIKVKSEDDGINATDGVSEGGMGGMGGMMQDSAASSDVYINISGGTLHVNADGDGIDSNGIMTISGGTVYVDGPTNSGNGALDAGSGSVITGGMVIALGSSGMAETFGTSSTQGSILYNMDETHSAGEQVTLKDSTGNELLTYKSEKTFNSVVVSTPDITSSGKYTLVVGSNEYSIEMTSISYSNGGSMMGGPGGMGRPGGDMSGFGGMGRPGDTSGFGGMDRPGDMSGFGGMDRPDDTSNFGNTEKSNDVSGV